MSIEGWLGGSPDEDNGASSSSSIDVSTTSVDQPLVESSVQQSSNDSTGSISTPVSASWATPSEPVEPSGDNVAIQTNASKSESSTSPNAQSSRIESEELEATISHPAAAAALQDLGVDTNDVDDTDESDEKLLSKLDNVLEEMQCSETLLEDDETETSESNKHVGLDRADHV